MALDPFAYFKQSKEELGKVVWPARSDTIRLTLVVLGISVVVGLYIAGIDAILAKLTEEFLR